VRTFILLCVVALVVGVGMAFAVGLVNVATDHHEGKYVVSFTVNADMICARAHGTEPDRSPGPISPDAVNLKGTITAVRADMNEFVLSENVKNRTFRLTKEGKVFLNERESHLDDLQAGDEATVTIDRQGEQFFATLVRCTRK
jgi:hypothetical protein